MSAKPGDIVTMASFDQNRTAHFASPRCVFVMLLLGEAVKTAKSQFDPGAALRRIGWYPESDFGPAEPGTGALEDRAAELAASMKVMAALHRANEDVAAADEFAKGAALVLELATEAERYRFVLACYCDESFGDQVESLLENPHHLESPTEAMMNERLDAGLNLARQAGIWPRKDGDQ